MFVVAQTVWYRACVRCWTVCDGTGEDASCADSVHFYDYSVEDHFYCTTARAATAPQLSTHFVRLRTLTRGPCGVWRRLGHPHLLLRGAAAATDGPQAHRLSD